MFTPNVFTAGQFEKSSLWVLPGYDQMHRYTSLCAYEPWRKVNKEPSVGCPHSVLQKGRSVLTICLKNYPSAAFMWGSYWTVSSEVW